MCCMAAWTRPDIPGKSESAGRPAVQDRCRQGLARLQDHGDRARVGGGEEERAGRWWWESPEHKECGLHLNFKNGGGI